MSIYDQVGSTYDSMRSSNIGVKDILQEIEILGSNINVLDLGCGTGHPIAKVISPVVSLYRGIDNSQPMLDAYMKNVPNADCALLDMSQIRQITGEWDFIFSWGAICHLPIELQKQTMTTVANLLPIGGRFLFTGGKEAGECTGKVGEYTVYHFSMGEFKYTEFLSELGMELVNASFSEGENYVYKYVKIT